MCRFPVPNFPNSFKKCETYGQIFFHLRKDSVASITQMFTKLTILQWRYVYIYNSEFYLNRSRNIESADKIPFLPLSKVTKMIIVYTGLHKNPSVGLVANAMSQVGRDVASFIWYKNKAFFFLGEESLKSSSTKI